MLENHWYIACPSTELNNKPVAATLFGRALVLFRDQDRRPAALDDRCQHRHAPLSCGHLENGTLRCPYHGWRYDSSGRLVDIPYAASGQTGNSNGIRSYPCCEQDGYVWVSVGQPAPGSRPVSFPHLHEDGWLSFGMDTLFDGTVESCLENFLDCPHALNVHRFWFRTPASKPVKATVRTLDDGAVVEYFSEPRGNSVVWLLLSPRSEDMKHTDRFIAPATSQVDYRFSRGREYVITSSCTPIDDHNTRVFTVISYRFKGLGLLVRPFFQLLARLIIRQDVQIMRLQHANIERFGRTDFAVIEQDVLFNPIREWRSALRHGTTPPPSGQELHVDMLL